MKLSQSFLRCRRKTSGVNLNFPNLPISKFAAFTLVELMVSIAIIGILASMILFAMVSAMTAAKKARTKVVVLTLDRLLMERWESYATIRPPVDLSGLSPSDPQYAKKIADRKLQGLRELMKIEMPDRWSDVTAAPILINPGAAEKRSTLAQAYKRRYDAAAAQFGSSPSTANQGAECLFLIITLGCGEGESRELFSADDIKDTDGDGMFEFVDGWGKPINFIRWPAGFLNNSDRQLYVTDYQHDELHAHDPFDPMGVEPNAYRLFPLIYSAGPDGSFDIVANGGPNAPAAIYHDVVSGKLNPYKVFNLGTPYGSAMLGFPMDTDSPPDGEQFWDNITNHLLDTR